MKYVTLSRALQPLRRRSKAEREHRALADLIRDTPFFNADWYTLHAGHLHRIEGDAALHYVSRGYRDGLEPGPHFSGRKYLERYPDVAAHDFAPLVHYLLHGRHENREIEGKPLPDDANQVPLMTRRLSRSERRTMRDRVRMIERSPYFDAGWYRETYFRDKQTPRSLAGHYLTEGARAGMDPSPRFSTQQYLVSYPDIVAAGSNPLLHLLLHGHAEGRQAFPVVLLPDAAAEQGGSEKTGSVAQARSLHAPSILFVSGEADTPGHHYRVRNYIDAARENGWHAECVRSDELADRLGQVSNFDHLMLWRTPWDVTIAEAVATMQDAGKTVIFDCDDLMTEPRLATAQYVDGIRSQRIPEDAIRDQFARLRQTMLVADLCFTTTDQLAFHMREFGKVTFVNPNGFSQSTHDVSRISARAWAKARDGLVRIGYAGGSRTHQKDLGQAMGAIVRILRAYPHCRLVLFRTPDGRTPLIDVEEYPDLEALRDQIEWRPLQPLAKLPTEMARFDINLAPLEVGNPFCEAKSELKFFEAALVDCTTVASPTGPFRKAIRHGETGFLAAAGDDWYACLERLVLDPDLRHRVGRNAYHAALARFGPRRRALAFGCVLDQLLGGRVAARGFAFGASLVDKPTQQPFVFPSDIMFEHETGELAEVTIVVPLYNCATIVSDTLDSVRDQTLRTIDLIIADRHSTDDSLEVALAWVRQNADRFNRIVVLKSSADCGHGLCRNQGFDAADTPYVLMLDAGTHLRPECAAQLLGAIQRSDAAYVYPRIQHSGSSIALDSHVPYNAQRNVSGNYVGKAALVAKEAWAMVGGYDNVGRGWEDYDFWARIAEVGLVGESHPVVLADSRSLEPSIGDTLTDVDIGYGESHLALTRRHPWIALNDTEASRRQIIDDPRTTDPRARTRLDDLLPLLRCPSTGHKLAYDPQRQSLISYDGLMQWRLASGRPCLAPNSASPHILSIEAVDTALSEAALALIAAIEGWALLLGSDGLEGTFTHVVKMDCTINEHTDVVGDAHHLPFDDGSFDAVVMTIAIEQYRDPVRVAAELHRVLKPGGRLCFRAAFFRPLLRNEHHRSDYLSSYGIEHWFEAFEIVSPHAMRDSTPGQAFAQSASAAEVTLRKDVSGDAADAFLAAPISQLVEMWRNPSERDAQFRADTAHLPQITGKNASAGLEFLATRRAAFPAS